MNACTVHTLVSSPPSAGHPWWQVRPGGAVADDLAATLSETGAAVWQGAHVKQIVPAGEGGSAEGGAGGGAERLIAVTEWGGAVEVSADVVVLACGARESGPTERGTAERDGRAHRVAGARTARIFHTTQVLDMLGGGPTANGQQETAMPANAPLLLGANLVGYSAAAKLRAAATGGGGEPLEFRVVVSDAAAVASSFSGWAEAVLARGWFGRVVALPAWVGGHGGATVLPAAGGLRVVGGVQLEGPLAAATGSSHARLPHPRPPRLKRLVAHAGLSEEATAGVDGVLVAGRLVPNSELLVDAGMPVALPSRRPIAQFEKMEVTKGWFVAGNLAGWVLPAQWCRWHGAYIGRVAGMSLEKERLERWAPKAEE